MPNRTAKFVSAIILSFIAGAPFATVSQGRDARERTTAFPARRRTPQGSHWYYRIEHPSNRHCWYLRDEQAAAVKHSRVDRIGIKRIGIEHIGIKDIAIEDIKRVGIAVCQIATAETASAMPGSVANARAELISPQPRSDPDASIVSGQVPAAANAPVADANNPAPTQVQDANMLRSVVATRWPDQLAANTPAAPTPATDNSNASAPADAVTPQPPAAAAAVVPLTAADVPPTKQSSSTKMLIIAIVGALSVAGLAASAVGFGGWRKDRPRIHRRRTPPDLGDDS